MSTPSGVVVQALQQEHWSSVREIYAQGLATGNASFETELPDWAAWDGSHLPRPRLVAESEGTVLGWAALSPVSRRMIYAGVAEVSIYVAAAHRGRGVGHVLMAALIAQSEEAGIWTLQAGLFPENLASRRLHEAFGFRLVGRRERIGRHREVWRDTLLYERRSTRVGV